MQNLFSYQFSQNIWRIIPDSDPDSDLWVIELRDVPEKKISFAVIDLQTQILKWHETPEGTDWWTSVTAFSYGHVFLHNYRYPDIPEPTDLLMVSAESGQLKWVLPNHLLVKTLNEQEVEVASKAGDKFIYSRCIAETGGLFTSGENAEQALPQIILSEPVRYRKGNIYFDKLSAFIQENTNQHIPICIDYLEKRPFMMFSYYIYEQEKVVEYLLVVSDNLQYIRHERLSEAHDGIGQSTMLLRGSKLVYLKNNNEFSSLTLSL